MSSKLAPNLRIDRAVIGHQPGFAAGVFDHDRAQRLSSDIGDMERARFAIALDKREHSSFFRWWPERLVLGLATDIAFVSSTTLFAPPSGPELRLTVASRSR